MLANVFFIRLRKTHQFRQFSVENTGSWPSGETTCMVLHLISRRRVLAGPREPECLWSWCWNCDFVIWGRSSACWIIMWLWSSKEVLRVESPSILMQHCTLVSCSGYPCNQNAFAFQLLIFMRGRLLCSCPSKEQKQKQAEYWTWPPVCFSYPKYWFI